MQPLVSILIPLYNAENWIADTIISALSQTWANKEIIIIDDGSEDNSYEIAKAYESESVRVYSQPNLGGSAARNKAFDLSKGDYIQYLDADDLLDSDKIEVQVQRLLEEPSETIASGAFQRFSKERKGSKYVPDSGWENHDSPVEWLIKVAFGKTMFPPIVWLTPRSIIKSAGPWNEELTYNDDLEFFTRVLLKSKKISFCNEAISFYRTENAFSVSKSNDSAAHESRLKCSQLFIKHLLELNDSKEVRHACATYLQRFIFSLYPKERKLIKIARNEIKELGVTGNRDFGNERFRLLSQIVGWKAAKYLRYVYYKLR